MGDQVTLNIGGQVFDTSIATMTKDPHSLLAKLALHDVSESSQNIKHAIKRDLQVLGYRITLQETYTDAGLPPAGIVYLQAGLSGPVEALLGSRYSSH